MRQPNAPYLMLAYTLKVIKLQVAVVLCPPFWYLRDCEPQPGQLHVVHANECRAEIQLDIRRTEQLPEVDSPPQNAFSPNSQAA